MFNQYLDLAEDSVKESIPVAAGVYIIALKFCSDMHPIPLYVGSSNNLSRRVFSYIKIQKNAKQVHATRPIEKLLYYVTDNIFAVSFEKFDEYLELEKSLISVESENMIKNLLNATGIGRSYIVARLSAKELTSKINFMLNLGMIGGPASSLITKRIIYTSENQYRWGLIVNCCTLNNTFTIYWEDDNELDKVSLDNIIYNRNYRLISDFSYNLLNKIKNPSKELLSRIIKLE